MVDFVADYGAVADGEYVEAIFSITASDTTLTCTTSVFPADIAGKGISVPGAASNGGTLVTTVASRTSATEVELDDPASTTITNRSCLMAWGTDNSQAILDFTEDHQGDSVVLNIPFGVYYSGYTNPPFGGISDLTVNGNGSTILAGIFKFGSPLQFETQVGVDSARTYSILPGATTLRLKDIGDADIFNVGQLIMISGYDTQGYGYPTNPAFFEFVRITNKADDVITFTPPVRNTYLDTWPNYNPASAPDHGGPATIYRTYPGFDCSHVYNDFTIGVDTEGFMGVGGRSVVMNNMASIKAPFFPSGGDTIIFNNCINEVGTMEIDKLVKNFRTVGGSYNSVFVQSACIDNYEAIGADIVVQLGTSRRTSLIDCNIGELVPGPIVHAVATELNCTGCEIDELSVGGSVDKAPGDIGMNFVVGASISNGTIILPDNYRGGPSYQMIPGANLFFSDTNGWIGRPFQILGVERDGSNILYHTNRTDLDDWPPIPFNATKIWFQTCPAARATFRNCTGALNVVGLNEAPANRPLFSWFKYSYTAGDCADNAQPAFSMIGNLVRLSINVITPYEGEGALTFALGQLWPVLDRNNNPDDTIFYQPVVNAKIAGERVITRSGVTGQQSGDSGLGTLNYSSSPDTDLDSEITWFTGNVVGTGTKFSADVSGSEPGVEVVVTFETDPGIANYNYTRRNTFQIRSA